MTEDNQQAVTAQPPTPALQRLVNAAPLAVPLTTQWLKAKGISTQVAYRYHRAGWLESLGRGAWKRTDQHIDWQAAIFALQSQLALPVWPAARTALELMGHAHYIPLSDHPQIQICQGQSKGDEGRLPDWYSNLDANRNLRAFKGAALFDPAFAGLMDWENGKYPLRISTPERAVLELCHLLPNHADAEEVTQIVSGLSGLRPEKLRELLLICRSIKAKRLFMALAESLRLPWFSRLDIAGVDFGSGKRALDWPGRLHPRYHITVPEAWLES